MFEPYVSVTATELRACLDGAVMRSDGLPLFAGD
jgi:hypothetical protein